MDAHLASTERTGERVVAGKTHGLLELGESVTWEARHLGMRLRQGSIITRLDRPHMFVDEAISGPLKAMRHLHQFVSEGDATLMVDTFDYGLPAGLLGRLADHFVVEGHLRQFLIERAEYLKAQAEGN
ncbi:MAG: SRPBCC family protein [Candidatus Dormiibacterota bacterium]